MNKYLKIALVAAIIIGVFLLSFFAKGKQSVEVIDYKQYQEIKEESGYVYYGSKNVLNDLKTFADEENLEISILDPADLSKSEAKAIDLEEGTIYLYKTGEVCFNFWYIPTLIDSQTRGTDIKVSILYVAKSFFKPDKVV